MTRTTKPAKAVVEGKTTEEYILEKSMERASRGSKKRFLRRTGESDIFVADGKAKTTEKTAIPEELIVLKAAEKNKTPFPVRITKIRNDHDFGLCAICEYGSDFYRTDIIIPWDKFTEIPDEEIEKKTTKFRHLQRMQNAEVDVIIESLKRKADGSLYAIGNRKLAMAKKRAQYWFADEIGRGGAVLGYRFNEGSIIESRIIGVYGQTGVRLDILGCEVLVPIRETSWARTHNLETKFAVGDTCNAKIMKLERNEKTGEVAVQASIKRTAENPVIGYAKNIKENDLVTGTVGYISINVDKPGKEHILVDIKEGVQVYCKGFPSAKIREGSLVQVYLREPIYAEGKEAPLLFGTIPHVIKY